MEGSENKQQLWKSYGLLVGICICSFILFIANNDFPLYFHADELKKLNFVLSGEQDFKHPVLLLQLARLANLLFREVDYQTLVSTMDATRSIEVDNDRVLLFPEVSVSALIL